MRHPDCTCPRAAHEHGQYATYTRHRCRCDVCLTANRVKERVRRRAKLYGRHWLVDAEPARQHIRALMAAGMGLKTIARAAGYTGSGQITSIVYGKYWNHPEHPERRPPRKQIGRDAEARILAIKPTLMPAARVDARGTRRRVQALVARGYSMQRIADAVGLSRGNFNRIHVEDQCLESTRVAVAALFDLWADVPPVTETRYQLGSVVRSVNLARARGWATAAAWDDIDLDEAPSLGEPATVLTITGRPSHSTVHPDDVAWMLRTCSTSWEAAERLGVSREYLLKLADRHGIDLPAHIRVNDADRAQYNRERSKAA